MEAQNKLQIFNKYFDLIFIKFPIAFPIIYGVALYTLPGYENVIIFIALLTLAEPHFGATWPFFLDKGNFAEIKNRKIRYIYMPIAIILLSLIGFFYANSFFLLFFFAINMFHVTRQSYGICKLYKSNEQELNYQEKIIYFFNAVFFIVGILRFYIPIIDQTSIFKLNIIMLFSLFFTFLLYYFKFKNLENFLTLITGSIIFFPICFVDKPIHGIVMGVLMHYTQYLALTYKVYDKRNYNNSSKQVNNAKFFGIKNSIFLIIILFYGLVMALLSSFSNFTDDTFKFLIVIPLVGQMLHFYLDGFLWKFSEKHNRENTLKHLYN